VTCEGDCELSSPTLAGLLVLVASRRFLLAGSRIEMNLREDEYY